MPFERGVSTDEKQFACGAISTPASPRAVLPLGGAFLIYSEALRYIQNISRAGVDLGLERMRELLDILGSPDEKLNVVHIAGTNGKGSVSAYLTSILKEAGYKVGTYNSPSVFCYNERWLIDGAPIDDDLVARYMTVVKDAVDGENKLREALNIAPITPTAFEIETALAFVAFFDSDVDVCVMETGLGGRWDATNAMRSKTLAVITPIGLDHCEYLGDTLGAVAAEKAAIIDGDAVTCPQCEEVTRALSSPYRDVDGNRIYPPCRLRVASEPVLLSSSLDGQKFLYEGKEYFIKMLGEHQLVNASIAICAARALAEKQFEISDKAIFDGLKGTLWRGRFEVIRDGSRFKIDIPKGKLLVLDGAHNPHGAATLKAAVERYLSGKRIALVTGILA